MVQAVAAAEAAKNAPALARKVETRFDFLRLAQSSL